MNEMDRLLLTVQIDDMVREGIIMKISFHWHQMKAMKNMLLLLKGRNGQEEYYMQKDELRALKM